MSFEIKLGFVFLVLFPIFQLGCYGLLYQKRGDIVFRKRNVTMIYIITIAAWLAYANLVMSLFGGVPCIIYHIFSILIPSLSIGIQLLRGVRLWGMLKRNIILSSSFGSSNNQKPAEDGYIGSGASCAVMQKCDSSGESSQTSDVHMHVTKDSILYEDLINFQSKVARLVGLVRLILIFFPLILILALLVTADSSMLAGKIFLECFPEPPFVLNGGRVLTIFLSVSAFCTTIFMNRCHDALGINLEIMRNIVILFMTNVIGFLLRYYDLMHWNSIIIVIQQMLLSVSTVIVPCYINSSVVKWVKSKGKRLIPGYARPIPQMTRKRGSMLLTGKKLTPDDVNENSKREREATMSLDAGLCILLSSNEGISRFTEHCSREFR